MSPVRSSRETFPQHPAHSRPSSAATGTLSSPRSTRRAPSWFTPPTWAAPHATTATGSPSTGRPTRTSTVGRYRGTSPSRAHSRTAGMAQTAMRSLPSSSTWARRSSFRRTWAVSSRNVSGVIRATAAATTSPSTMRARCTVPARPSPMISRPWVPSRPLAVAIPMGSSPRSTPKTTMGIPRLAARPRCWRT